MTSQPDVQNVPDVWTLLEQAYKLMDRPEGYRRQEISDRIEAALAVRDRFVLMPKGEPSANALQAGYARYRYAQDSGHDIDWRVVKECIYAVLAAAPKPEEKP